eukprot:scaffold5395_cov126-Cylindrotheca_fusiformis.AAC.3
MLGCSVTSAFVQPYSHAAMPSHVGSFYSNLPPMSATQLDASRMLDPVTQSLCRSFFQGFTTPSTLIAGSSFAALFALGTTVKEWGYMSKRDLLFMKLYHVCSLLSFCLSLTTVFSGQAALTRLLSPQPVTTKMVATDAYQFLRAYMNMEFLMTRWSFVTSIVFFLMTTCFRLILEFELFTKRKRQSAGVTVVALMTGGSLTTLSHVNSSGSKWPGVWEMTRDIVVVRTQSS